MTANAIVNKLLETRPSKPLLASWDDVDWSLNDATIARQLTCTPAIAKRNRNCRVLRSFGVDVDWCNDTYCKPQTRVPPLPPEKPWHEY